LSYDNQSLMTILHDKIYVFNGNNSGGFPMGGINQYLLNLDFDLKGFNQSFTNSASYGTNQVCYALVTSAINQITIIFNSTLRYTDI